MRDASGAVVFSQSVACLPQDANLFSVCVIKVPDVTSGPQVGIKATLLPTAVETPFAGVVSAWPELLDPAIYFTMP